jgi:hypothetical protein
MIISLGHNCFPAQAIKKINQFQPSLPFDSIGNWNNEKSLMVVYTILSLLKSNQLDISLFTEPNEQLCNKFNFHISHFFKNRHRKSILSNNELYEDLNTVFSRRFTRLKNNFFSQPNLIFYTSSRSAYEIELYHTASKIISLNPLNRLVIIGPQRPPNLPKQIEYIHQKRKLSKRTHEKIFSYFSNLDTETQSYYNNFVNDNIQ